MTQKLVQVKLSDDTLNRIDSVKRRLHSSTKTGAIRSSVDIADMVTKALDEGSNVIIEDKNGHKFRIVIPGIIAHKKCLKTC